MYLQGGGWTVRDSVLRENLIAYNADVNGAGTGRGAGVYFASGSHLLKNCLVIGNRAPVQVTVGSSQGDAIYVAAGTVTVQNVTAGFHVYEGIRCGGGVVTMTDSIFWGNGNNVVGVVATNVSCCDIGPADRVFSAAQTNLSVDPLFERGFYLAAGSPCVDAGSQLAANAGLGGTITRADGTADTGTVDLGYHFAAGVVPATADFYVSSGTGSDANSGTNAVVPFRTITKALSGAADGTRIHIGAGSYTNGAETFPLAVSGKLGLQLLGAGSGSTMINATGANTRAVYMTYTYPDARLEGLAITGVRWTAPVNTPVQGGGVYLNNSGISIVACAITNNYMQGNGWGWGGSAGANWGGAEGGGLYALWCDGMLSNCTVKGNTMSAWVPAGANGGGIWANERWTFANCIVAQNVAYAAGSASWYPWATGGGMQLEGYPIVRNCLLYGNDAQAGTQATPKGDGIYFGSALSGATSGLVENCTVVTNLGYGLYQDGVTVVGRNLIVWNNGVDVTNAMTIANSDLGTFGGETLNNCISTNPLFAFAATNDYRLLYASPCINQGTNQTWMTNSLDLAGVPRLQNLVVDMGAYETLVPAGGTVFVIR